MILPKVSKELLPWLLKQRKEAVDGCYYFDVKEQELVHDGSGLDKAEKDFKSIANKLAGKNSADMITILNIQLGAAQIRIDYNKWRMDILDRTIEETKK